MDVYGFLRAEISLPLFKLPAALRNLSVFAITASKISEISKLLNITTLATLLVPASGTTSIATTAQGFSIPDLSIDSIKALAATFQANVAADVSMSSLTNLLNSFKLPNLASLLKPATAVNKLDINAVVTQWIAANTIDLPLPKLELGDLKLTSIKVLIPGIKFPAIIVPKLAEAFVKAPTDLPLFVIPAAALKSVAQLLPNLTSVATVLVDKSVKSTIPVIKVGEVTVPNFAALAMDLTSALLPKVSIPGLPAMPTLLNVQSVNLNGLVSYFNNMEEGFKNITQSITQGASEAALVALDQLQSSLGRVADAVLPDGIESAIANMIVTGSIPLAVQKLQTTISQGISGLIPDSFEALFQSVAQAGGARVTDPDA